MKKNILIISKNIKEAGIISELLMESKNGNVFIEKMAKDVLNRIKETPIDVLVMNLDLFGMTQVHLIEQIRQIGLKFKIIVLAEKLQVRAQEEMEHFSDLAVIGKSQINLKKDFIGFYQRVLEAKKIAKRTAPRHLSKQAALIKNISNHAIFNCTVFNLSSTGAYLEFSQGHLSINDKVQIIIPLSDLGKTHVFHCRIAWLQLSPEGLRRAGLRFTGRSVTAYAG